MDYGTVRVSSISSLSPTTVTNLFTMSTGLTTVTGPSIFHLRFQKVPTSLHYCHYSCFAILIGTYYKSFLSSRTFAPRIILYPCVGKGRIGISKSSMVSHSLHMNFSFIPFYSILPSWNKTSESLTLKY